VRTKSCSLIHLLIREEKWLTRTRRRNRRSNHTKVFLACDRLDLLSCRLCSCIISHSCWVCWLSYLRFLRLRSNWIRSRSWILWGRIDDWFLWSRHNCWLLRNWGNYLRLNYNWIWHDCWLLRRWIDNLRLRCHYRFLWSWDNCWLLRSWIDWSDDIWLLRLW
jgi:hypothetical protein